MEQTLEESAELYFDLNELDACIQGTCAECVVLYPSCSGLVNLLASTDRDAEVKNLFRLATAQAMTIAAALMGATEDGVNEVAKNLEAHDDERFLVFRAAVLDVMSRQSIADNALRARLHELARTPGTPFVELIAA